MWQATSVANVPVGRAGAPAVWTGREMIVWGGSISGGPETDSGGHYDPVTDTWSATSMAGVPEPSFGHTAVWTGTEMLVWGGYFTNELAGYRNDLVFRDDFESGNTGAWSLVVP